MQFNPKIWSVLILAWSRSGDEIKDMVLEEDAIHEYVAACDGRAVFDTGLQTWSFEPNPKTSGY